MARSWRCPSCGSTDQDKAVFAYRMCSDCVATYRSLYQPGTTWTTTEAKMDAGGVETREWTPPSLIIERQNVLASKMSTLKRELWRIGRMQAMKLREWPVCKQTGNPMPMSVLIYDGGSRVMVTIECQHGDCESFQIGTAAPEHLTRAWKALDTTDAIRATEENS